jgi:O-antigen biosynthesis protein
MPSPAISFLLCTRNRAETARECVRHLLTSPRQDFEVVVRDNCSSDNTVALLRTIDDPRLTIHTAPNNQGTISFHEISKLARGEIVTWLSD